MISIRVVSQLESIQRLSSSFTHLPPPSAYVFLFLVERADRQYAQYPTTDIRHILPLLQPSFEKANAKSSGKALKQDLEEKIKAGHVDKVYTAPQGGKEIKHDWLWSRMGGWFNDTDIILTETGTSSFGLTNVPLPPKATYIAQILWGSIGWSVGATLGAALAAKEAKEERRTVLFVGDGSLQLVSLLPMTWLTVDGPRDRYHAPKRSLPILIRPQQRWIRD